MQSSGTDIQSEILAQIKQIRDLPTLPAVFVRIIRLLRDPRVLVKDMARVVESDQAITMKILRLINSSFYGMPRRVSSVHQAIIMLGANTLKNVVISASVFKALGGGSQDQRYRREAFSQHSISCGMIARFLGNKVNCGREEEGFISGIIHDIGKVVLDQYFHDKFIEIVDRARESQVSFHQAELEIIGTTHSAIGAVLAESWSLPPNLVEVVASHHDFAPESEFARLVALVQISDQIAHQYSAGSGGDDPIPTVDPLAWQAAELSPEQILKWEEEIKVEIQKGAELLEIMLT